MVNVLSDPWTFYRKLGGKVIATESKKWEASVAEYRKAWMKLRGTYEGRNPIKPVLRPTMFGTAKKGAPELKQILRDSGAELLKLLAPS